MVARRTLAEVAARAKELGHVAELTQRGPWPEHGDPHPKFYVTCSCGWVMKAKRNQKEALRSVVWHYGRMIGETDGLARKNGVSVQKNAGRLADSPSVG